ncbi:fatty acid hydroxylase [Aspergillus pseudoustus]|uniref:Bifunctional cytochrome P450/NADPH--P450 reductase n=1 Tax=Aspergillus pseudoustus TaxID=1810923 RepID=A0ABR4JZH4_9EURO
MSQTIPQPPSLPLLGNVHNIDLHSPLQSFEHLAARYGDIFKLRILGTETIFIASHRLFRELCDDKRFQKSLPPPLLQLRHAVSSGLFTAFEGEHEWGVAHRILAPAFGPLNVQSMFVEMHEICSQLVLKWSRLDDGESIDVAADFTRLTLDSIALCAMDTRFNSFYSNELHPFVHAMVEVLVESGQRSNRPPIANALMKSATRKYEENIELMKQIARTVLDRRRREPSDKKDLLNALICGRDPKTGESMSDDSIINNMITFLIAGHETTSGLLSFTLYLLVKNPDTYRKAQAEVDKVVGGTMIKFEHISKLKYVQACLRESLRLYPTAPAFSREVSGPTDEVIGNGEYRIPKGVSVICLLGAIQRDHAIYGPGAELFKPERMLDEAFKNLPGDAWKPFGTGPRACIGRPFAWQEAILALAMVLQNFDMRLVDPSYELQIVQTLTIKPNDLLLYKRSRGDHRPGQLERRLFGESAPAPSQAQNNGNAVLSERPKAEAKPLTVLYGSNTGTCEGLAQGLANRAVAHGFTASIGPMDSAIDRLPSGPPVVIVTASFEGAPADNASQFMEWVKNSQGQDLRGVEYAVFGCGHRDWASTYQKIPKELDTILEKRGATRLVERGESDVSAGTVLDDFDGWADTTLWPALSNKSEPQSGEDFNGLDVEITPSTRVSSLRHNVSEARVEQVAILSGTGVREKRSITFRLPSRMTYSAGDYLNVLPLNPPETVNRVLKRFGLPWDAEITIQPTSHTSLPVSDQWPLAQLLSQYVELGSPASKKSVLGIARLSEGSMASKALRELAADHSSPPESVLDILERYPDLVCPFGFFLSLLPPMRMRRYSISSSPLVDPTLASVTYGVVNEPISTRPESRFLGVTTNYLKRLETGSIAQISVKKSHYSFHLPSDTQQPVIMVCAGTGIAPFRGFVEERAEKVRLGKTLGPALLFVGCKNSHSDRLYAAEFEEWQRIGAVEVFYAFSQEPEASDGAKYVQHRIYAERSRFVQLLLGGGRVYVCGSSQLGNAINEICKRVMLEYQTEAGSNMKNEDVETWFDELKIQGRWSSDVFN